MSGTFNGHILVDKLAKLNNSQQSIETLSHWCIFHMNKAKQVVETWDRQYHCSPREQRLAFLYLANDILQNSRRKGSEFVAEFWKVLPDALNDVIENGDDFGRKTARRLVDIWDERKVFGSRGKVLKEELVGKNIENTGGNVKSSEFKLKQQSVGTALGKIISSYEVVYGDPIDEEALKSKFRAAIDFIDKLGKEIGGEYTSGQLSGSEFVELQGQHGILRDCIEQLSVTESSRATLVSHLREALQEQFVNSVHSHAPDLVLKLWIPPPIEKESFGVSFPSELESKLEQVRVQLQAAQSHSEQVGSISQQLNSGSRHLIAEQRLNEPNNFHDSSSGFPGTPVSVGDKEQSPGTVYTQRGSPLPNSSSYTEEDPRKSAVAAVAAKLAASSSSAEMLTFVLSSLASEGVIGNKVDEHPQEKRQKHDNSNSSFSPQSQNLQPPLPPFPHPESAPAPLPTSSPPPLPPLPPQPSPQFMQTAGSMTSVPYSYGSGPPRPPLMPSYSVTGPPLQYSPPPNPYQNFQGPEGSFYSQPPLPATPQASRQ
ncbi:hypothetical protein GIB67_041832 [Kingdonia uniflora]|uniref:CID domain-containing protein n=1 Tax=Kingdonia uniflora TaxID=39325 RepID=A0A7J7L5X8_9MAGN|nr:hypothetical protein GIB67_041832 [Kingdonia uniflora]